MGTEGGGGRGAAGGGGGPEVDGLGAGGADVLGFQRFALKLNNVEKADWKLTQIQWVMEQVEQRKGQESS